LKILIRGERFAKLRRSSIVKMSWCRQGEWAFVKERCSAALTLPLRLDEARRQLLRCDRPFPGTIMVVPSGGLTALLAVRALRKLRIQHLQAG
jgi:hypothetical protein